MNFLKTYIKTRAVKQLIQWLIIALVSILSLSAFAVADAYALAGSTCEGADLAGTVTPVPLPNTDVLDFSTSGTADFYKYQAEICPYTGGTYFELKGWVWDTNLGWISLYCKDGLNAGLACGAVNYGVKVNISDGKMYGWGWHHGSIRTCSDGRGQGGVCIPNGPLLLQGRCQFHV